MVSWGVRCRVAYRYFVSKKSHSVINLISWVSVAAIATPVAAMIILLSVHNGFEELIATLWGGYGAPLVVENRDGSSIIEADFPSDKVRSVEGVAAVTGYTEGEFLISYKERQVAATVRGVDSLYLSATNLHKAISHGKGDINSGAIMGLGIAHSLGLKINLSSPFTVIAPTSGGFKLFGDDYYHKREVALSGVFMIDAQRDSELLFLNKEDVFALKGGERRVVAFAVGVENGADIDDIAGSIEAALGSEYVVKNLLQQNELEYKMVKSEKFAIFMIIMLITVVASLTIIGTMLMLIMEKRGSSRNLYIIGFTNRDIKSLFTTLGLIIAATGVIIGVITGCGVVIAQQLFSFVPLFGGGLLVDSYPVRLMFGDVSLVVLSVMLVASCLVYVSCALGVKGNEGLK